MNWQNINEFDSKLNELKNTVNGKSNSLDEKINLMQSQFNFYNDYKFNNNKDFEIFNNFFKKNKNKTNENYKESTNKSVTQNENSIYSINDKLSYNAIENIKIKNQMKLKEIEEMIKNKNNYIKIENNKEYINTENNSQKDDCNQEIDINNHSNIHYKNLNNINYNIKKENKELILQNNSNNITQNIKFILQYITNYMDFNRTDVIPKNIFYKKLTEIENINLEIINSHIDIDKYFKNNVLKYQEIQIFLDLLVNKDKNKTNPLIMKKKLKIPKELKETMKSIFKILDINKDYVVDRENFIKKLKNSSIVKKYLNLKFLYKVDYIEQKTNLEKILDQIVLIKYIKLKNKDNISDKKYISWVEFNNFFRNFQLISQNFQNNSEEILLDKNLIYRINEIFENHEKINNSVLIVNFINKLREDNLIRSNFQTIIRNNYDTGEKENLMEILEKIESQDEDYITYLNFLNFFKNKEFNSKLTKNKNSYCWTKALKSISKDRLNHLSKYNSIRQNTDFNILKTSENHNSSNYHALNSKKNINSIIYLNSIEDSKLVSKKNTNYKNKLWKNKETPNRFKI